MLLVLPVPFRLFDGELYVEAQAANGLDRWADFFSAVTVAAPVIPETLLISLSGFVWRRLSSLQNIQRISPLPLPWAYSPASFLRALSSVRSIFSAAIRQSDFLQFAIGGLVGDWAALAAVEAIKQHRRYAIHTDRVEHDLIRKTAQGASPVRRIRVALEAPIMKRYHRYIIEHCSLGLWHGADCFRAYSTWCSENHLIHDVHTKREDVIDNETLQSKLQGVNGDSPLRIVYAGRLDPMKAPLEWLAAIASARDMGASLQATWFGEGAMLEDAVRECRRLGLESTVTYAGFVSDRQTLLQSLRAADVLVFTHVTPESPRILIESLVSGTPIAGYANEYAQDLTIDGGGVLVPLHDTHALAAELTALANRPRHRLVELIRLAAQSGSRFSDQAVFAERSALIKQFA